MKRILLIAAISLLLVSCSEEKNPVAQAGGTLINTYKRGQQAGETANLDAVKKTVQAYQAANDRYPETLDEIKGMIRSEIDTSKYDYDPQTGEVRLKGR